MRSLFSINFCFYNHSYNIPLWWWRHAASLWPIYLRSCWTESFYLYDLPRLFLTFLALCDCWQYLTNCIYILILQIMKLRFRLKSLQLSTITAYYYKKTARADIGYIQTQLQEVCESINELPPLVQIIIKISHLMKR